MQRENPTVLDIYGFENVRHNVSDGVYPTNLAFPLHHHHAGVFGPPIQHPQSPPGVPIVSSSAMAGSFGSRSLPWVAFHVLTSSSKTGFLPLGPRHAR